MPKTYLHWCPKGCGKKVWFKPADQIYYCMGCGREFNSKEELL